MMNQQKKVLMSHSLKPSRPAWRRLLAPLCLIAAGWVSGLAAPAQAGEPAALRPIERLDLPRYLGTWYEVAKFPNRFQKQCVADTRAEYQSTPEGAVRVVNQCRLADGSVEKAVGQARQIGAADSPRLQVRFAPAWLSFIPAVWGDYWVIDLDEGYQLAAVSEPRREYLWVLSRTPSVPAPVYEALLKRLAAQGLDVGRLERSPQGSAP